MHLAPTLSIASICGRERLLNVTPLREQFEEYAEVADKVSINVSAIFNLFECMT